MRDMLQAKMFLIIMNSTYFSNYSILTFSKKNLLPLTPSSTKNVEEGDSLEWSIPPLPRFLWRRGLGGGG
jgi:hypothetical protein